MFKNLARLGRVASGIQPLRINSVSSFNNKQIVASLHVASNPLWVNASLNAATTPSTPLPPPMASLNTNKEKETPTPKTTAAASSSVEKEAQAEEEEDEQDVLESRRSTGFAEEIEISKEQARSFEENPILKQLVNTIMKDGKKARAQRFVADALLEIRARTQSDPYQVVLDGLELASPILRLTAVKKGSKVLQVPSPMTERQRRRKAIVWILEASDKRKGEKLFKDRLASEFLAVVNGNSGALSKKNQQHKMALANRANASLKY
ncbi:hypothetical protein BGZ49_006776 [Haplosporangium sp. Z 27]|nr:hypothetical protein BGZ49_006776 [Haplosporangium sp. Z 27]